MVNPGFETNGALWSKYGGDNECYYAAYAAEAGSYGAWITNNSTPKIYQSVASATWSPSLGTGFVFRVRAKKAGTITGAITLEIYHPWQGTFSSNITENLSTSWQTFELYYKPAGNPSENLELRFQNTGGAAGNGQVFYDNAYFGVTNGGSATGPDISVRGTNMAAIADGNTSSQLADGTDFGDVPVTGGAKEHTFTVTNSGTAALVLQNVAIGGTHATNFSVSAQPNIFTNLLRNGDFSQNGVPAALGTTNISSWSSWGSSGYYNNDIDSQMSVKMWWDDSGLYQDWTCTTGAQYDLSVYARQRDADPLVNWHGYLKVEFYNAANSKIEEKELDYISSADPTNQWILLTGSYTSPANSAYGRVVLGINNWAESPSGSAYFDNASVNCRSLAAGSQTTFKVTFNPSDSGARTATVYITNNVTAKNPYDFTIQGTGLAVTVWDGGGANGNWDTTANWALDTVPAAADEVFFYTNITSGTNINLNGNRTVLGVRFNDTADTALNITNSTLTINQSGIAVASGAAGAHVIASTVALGAAQTWTNDSSTNLTVNGVISGANVLRKAGSGVVVLTSNNTFSSGLYVDKGTVRLQGHTNAMGAGAVQVGTNATLELNYGAATLSPVALTLYNGNVTKTVTGSTTWRGTFTNYNSSTVTVSSGNFYIYGGMNLASGTLVFSNASESGMGAGGTMTGSGHMTKQGAGAFRLYPGTHSGNITLSAGEIRQYTGTMTASGTLTMEDGTTYRTETTSARTMTKASQINGNVTLGYANGGDLTFSGNMSLNSGVRMLSMDNTNTVSGVISSGGLNKTGVGMLILSGVNTYDSATIVSNGILRISNTWGLGGTAAGTTVRSGAALELTGGINTPAETLNLSGDGIAGAGALRNISGNNSYNGAITLAAASRINSDSGTLTLGADGDVGGAGLALTVGGADTVEIYGNLPTGAATLTKDGAGTLKLNNSSATRTWTGATTISAGTLQLTAPNGISDSSAVSISAGATLDLNGNNNTVGSIAGAGSITLGGGTLTAGGDNTSTTFSGVMSGAGGKLIKAGSGALTLSGTSTHNGDTTVSAGKLIQNGTNSSSAVTVNSGAFLYGGGQVAALTIGGRASAGTASNTVGKLKAAALNLESNGVLQVEITNMTGTAGIAWDLVEASGTITVNASEGSKFVIALKGNPAGFSSSQSWTNTIITTAGSLSESFATNKFTVNLAEFTPALGGGSFSVNKDGNNIRLLFAPGNASVDVIGNGNSISDGDDTPSLTDYTDFGPVLIDGSTLTRTFTITNSGTADLGVGPIITNSVNPHFVVIAQPSSPVTASGATTFQIRFDPSSLGITNCEIQFTNTISAMSPYNFTIQGTGTGPDITVHGTNGSPISDEDNTPQLADGSDFGNVAVNDGTKEHTFTITNSGSANLVIANAAIGGTHAADFSVSAQPNIFTNLLRNGDFSQNGVPAQLGTTNISSWSSWGSSGYYNDDIDSQMSVKMWWDDSGLWQDWSATAGEVYTLAVDARQQSTDPLVSWRGYLKVEFYNSTSGQIASQELDYLTPTDSKDTWLQLSGTYTAPVDTVYGRILLGMNNWASNAAGSVYFDNASVNCRSLAAGSQTTFKVTFNPSDSGARTATVYITNNVTAKNPYNFVIQGTGTAPDIVVLGTNMAAIAISNISPTTVDGTDFGDVAADGGTKMHTFTITNGGNDSLTIENVAVGGVHAADFIVAASGSASPNLIPNPGFETNAADWTISGNAWAQAGVGEDSSTALALTNAGDNEVNQRFANPNSNSVCKFTVRAKKEGTIVASIFMQVYAYNSAGVETWNSGETDISSSLTTDWATYTKICSGMPVDTVTNKVRLHNYGGSAGNGQILFDNAYFGLTNTTSGFDPVAAGDTTTFNVTFNPSAGGTRTATIFITNNVTGKNPYDFTIQGTGTYAEIAVSGNGNNITNNDNSPTSTDFTDFGAVALEGSTLSHTFYITNTGNRAMGLGSVTVSGTHATNFVVTAQPSSPLNPSNSTSFTVQFNPSAVGLRSASLSFTNTDDSTSGGETENPFNFDIQGAGVAPAITNYPTTLSFSSVLGSAPAAQKFSVTNCGLGSMAYTLSTNASWLTVLPVSATVSAGAGQVHTTTVATVSGMQAGTSNATITITSADATNSPKTIAVTWTITAIPNPSAQTATADGTELVRLAWTKNGSYDVMIVYRSDVAPTNPTQGTAYSVGSSCGGGTVIYKGNASYLEHVLPAGTAAYYKFHSYNGNYYSAGGTANATLGLYKTDELVEPFAYTNGVSLGSLNGGNGWTNAWSVGSGTWTIQTNVEKCTFVSMPDYPGIAAQRVKLVDPGNNGSGNADRSFAAVTSGTIYASVIMAYSGEGTSKWAGLSFMNSGVETGFVGKGSGANSYTLGIATYGGATEWAGYNLRGLENSTNNTYLLIARYNFSTKELSTKAYNRTASVPLNEPATWDASVTVPGNGIVQINGIRLSGGGTDGGSIGDVYFDEVRVASSWNTLLNTTQPYATNYSVNTSNFVSDAQITSGGFDVSVSIRDATGMQTTNDYDIWNSAGTQILTNEAFGTDTFQDSGKTVIASDSSHAGAGASAITLGTYTTRWSAVSSNNVWTTDSATLSNGTAMTFTVFDDDSRYPVMGNLLKNPGFEVGDAGNDEQPEEWWCDDDGGSGNETWAARTGTNGYAFWSWEGNDGWYANFGQNVYVDLDSGDVVTFTIWGLAQTSFVSSTSEAWIKLEFWTGGSQTYAVTNDIYAQLVGNYDTWIEYRFTYTNTEDGITLVKPIVGSGNWDPNPGNAALKWDDATFTVGTHPLRVFVGDTDKTDLTPGVTVHTLTDADLAGNALSLVLEGYDEDSGLSLGTSDSETRIHVTNLTTNDGPHYANSSPDTTAYGSTNTWSWTSAFNSATIQALMDGGSNEVLITARDTDNDRVGDQLSTSNRLVGYLRVMDDDDDPPTINSASNLLQNVGFEIGSGTDIPNWTPWEHAYAVGRAAYSGTNGVEFTSPGWANIWQGIPGTGPNLYTLSFYVRKTSPSLDMDIVYMKIEFHNVDLPGTNLVVAYETNILNSLTTDWQLFTFSAATASSGIKHVRASIGMGEWNGYVNVTTVQVDSVAFTESLPPLSVQIGSTNYPATSGSWTNAIYTLTDADLAGVDAGNPLHLAVHAYDAYSGLQRSDSAGAESTSMVLSVANIITNNLTLFEPDISSDDTTMQTATSVWEFTSFSDEVLGALVAAGDNEVRANLYDADADRNNDQLSETGKLLGYLRVSDDDSDYPVTGNLLENPGFEIGTTGYGAAPSNWWGSGHGGNENWAEVRSGTNGYGFWCWDTNWWAYFGQDVYVDVDNGDVVTFTIWGRANTGFVSSNSDAYIKLEFWAGGTMSYAITNDIYAQLVGNYDAWTEYRLTYTNTENGITLVKLVIGSSGWAPEVGAQSIMFDDATFTVGTHPLRVFVGDTDKTDPTPGVTVHTLTDADLAGVDEDNALSLVLEGYDEGSGLSLGTSDSETRIHVTNLTTNDGPHYANSSPDTTAYGSTNTWSWASAFDSATIQALMDGGSNEVLITARDTDNDRVGDQLSTSNRLAGYLRVMDDDPAGPIFSSMDVPGGSRANLRAGSIAILGFEADAPDKFAFVTLDTIWPGTVINFTDYGWDTNTDTFAASSEGILKWTSPANLLNPGTVIQIDDTTTASTGTVSQIDAGFDLAAGGDQLLAYQSTDSSTTFLYAVSQTASGGWLSSGTPSSGTSYLPPGLTLLVTEQSPSAHQENGYFTSATLSGTRESILTNVSAHASWTWSTDPVSFPTWSVTVSDPVVYVEVTDGAPYSGIMITGLVQDAYSGVYRAGNFANSPTVTVYNSAGAVVGGAYLTTGPANNGDALNTAEAIGGIITFAAEYEAVYTAKVVVADYDVDRANDSTSATQVIVIRVTGDDDDTPGLPGAFQPGNLLRNPGFEWQHEDGTIYEALYWTEDSRNPLYMHGGYWGTAARTTTNYQDGAYCGAIRGTWSSAGTDGGFWQEVTNELGAGAVWEASAYVYNDAPWTCVWQAIYLDFYNDNANSLSGATNVFSNPGGTWTRVSVLATAPVGAVYARLNLGAWGVSASGALSIDNMSLRVVTNTTMDFMIGGQSFYRSGYGSNVLFRVTDGDLATVSDTNLMKFIFNVYDPGSGLLRSTTETNLNYDIGSQPEMQDFYSTYSAAMSSTNTTISSSTSVFVHASNFTISGPNADPPEGPGQTGMVWALMGYKDPGVGYTNDITLSGPDADADRPYDATWFTNSLFGRLSVSDDDMEGPFQWLIYVGDDFTWGSYNTNPVSDGQMTNGFDVAYGIWDASGVLVSNMAPGSTNVDGQLGQVAPNWDLVRPDNVELVANGVPGAGEIFSPKGNGSYNATVVVHNVSAITYAQNTIGVWQVRGSAEDLDWDRGYFIRTNAQSIVETCSWDRAVSSDYSMQFTVYDDDTDYPTVTSYANGRPLGVWIGTNNVAGSANTTNAVFNLTDGDLASVGGTNLVKNFSFDSGNFAFWSYDATGWHVSDNGAVNDVLTNELGAESRVLHQEMAASPGETFNASAHIRAMAVENSYSYLEMQFWDSSGNLINPDGQFQSTYVTADQPFTLTSISGLAPAGTVTVSVRAVVTVINTNYPTTMENADFHIFDDFMLKKADRPLKLVFSVFDGTSGLSRSGSNTNTDMNVDVGIWMTNNMVNFAYNLSSGDSTVNTATNVWQWENLNPYDIEVLYQGGSNKVVASLFDSDNDRINDTASLPEQQFGYLYVTDDDTTTPTTREISFGGVAHYLVAATNNAGSPRIVEDRDGDSSNVIYRVTDSLIANLSASDPLYIAVGAIDVGSGLARGTEGETNTISVISIGDVLSGSSLKTNYDPSLSSEAGPNQVATNVWTFDGDPDIFTDTMISNLVTLGTSTVFATLVDADNDRPNDQAAIYTQQVGYFAVIDDDTVPPSLTSMRYNGGTNTTDGSLNDIGLSITGLIQDTSGIWNSDTITLQIFNPTSSIGNTQYMNDNAIANGGATTPTPFGKSSLSISYGNRVLGTWTALVTSTDYDNDGWGTGDNKSGISNFTFQVTDDDSNGPTLGTINTVSNNVNAGIIFATGFENADHWTNHTVASTPWADTNDFGIWSGSGNGGVSNGCYANNIGDGYPSGSGRFIGINTVNYGLTLPPVTNPGTLTLFAKLSSGGPCQLAVEREQGASWVCCGTNDIIGTNYAEYSWTIDYSGNDVTLRVQRVGSSGSTIYFDNLTLSKQVVWLSATAVTNYFNPAIDSSGIYEYYRSVPTLTTTPMTATSQGVSLGTATSFVYDVTGLQGVLTGYVMAVDADNDRPNDGAIGNNSSFVIRIDTNPPAKVTGIVAEEGPDSTSEIELRWEALTNGGGHGSDPLSPWRTYAIYYAEGRDPDTNDPCIIWTNGYPSLNSVETSSIILSNFSFGTTYKLSVAGWDEAGNIGPLSTSTAVTLSGFYVTQGVVRVDMPQGPSIAWTISTNVVKTYDLLHVDAEDFSDTLANQWQRLASTTNSWFLDNTATNLDPNKMRFYRAAQHDQWLPSRVPRAASVEVYGLKRIQMYQGQNWVALPLIPDSNSVKNVLGYDLPGGMSYSDSNATRVIWYKQTNDVIAKTEIWLSKSGQTSWQYQTGGSGTADDMSIPLTEGFIIQIPTSASVTTNTIMFVGRVPTNETSQTIEYGYNVVGFRTPRRMHPSQMNLIDSGFQGASSTTYGRRAPMYSDLIWSFTRSSQNATTEAWYDTATGRWRLNLTSQNHPDVPANYFGPDDGLIILRRTNSTSFTTWITPVPYTPPTKNMTP